MTVNVAYLSLGSNMGNKEDTLKQAVDLTSKIAGVKLLKKSGLYQTDPVGYVDQDLFLNAVIKVETTLTALELLRKLQDVENALGRKRTIRWGPRTMDIDILLYNEEIYQEPDLIIPHPQMHNRHFVLVPLCEIEENIAIPGMGFVGDVLKDLEDAEGISLVKNYDKW